jgi:membrane-associated phospholipid phosphatase
MVFRVRSARLFLLISVLCALGVAAVYWAARSTELGIRVDTSAIIRGLTAERAPRLHRATSDLLHTIDVSSLVLMGGGLIGLALLRRRIDAAVGVAVVLIGANETTQVLKPALGRADFFEGASRFGASYPSGHATVAMSLALAAVLAAPRGLRLLTAAAGAVYATAVGVALIALGWHYPSDVAGGYLVSGAWTGLAAAGLAVLEARRARPRQAVAPSRRATAALIVLLTLGFTIGVAVAASRRPELISYSRLHTLFFVSCAGLAALSVLLAATTAALLEVPTRRA